MLHVTNGSSVSLDRTGLGGEILTWLDVLHEGPVPAGLPLGELSRLRGIFLDGASPESSPNGDALAERDRTLARFHEHEEVALWFEHDLYDQLQLIQILDWLHGRSSASTRFSLICVDRYLGTLTGEQLATLWPSRHTVTSAEYELAAEAWGAFRSADPMDIQRLCHRDTHALPFLAGALLRHLQEFPSTENGLSRTERQILEVVDAGETRFHKLFRANQQREERIFMGDTSFARYVRGLCECRTPLLRDTEGEMALTHAGRDVLAKRADHVHLNGINRWLGGVHLLGAEALWRWDDARQKLVRH